MTAPTAVDLSSVVTISDDLVTSDMDGEVVMMSVDRGEYYGLDEIGSRVWTLLEAPVQVSELCALLMEEFNVEREQCEQDVLAFLNEMAAESLVNVVNT